MLATEWLTRESGYYLGMGMQVWEKREMVNVHMWSEAECSMEQGLP